MHPEASRTKNMVYRTESARTIQKVPNQMCKLCYIQTCTATSNTTSEIPKRQCVAVPILSQDQSYKASNLLAHKDFSSPDPYPAGEACWAAAVCDEANIQNQLPQLFWNQKSAYALLCYVLSSMLCSMLWGKCSGKNTENPGCLHGFFALNHIYRIFLKNLNLFLFTPTGEIKTTPSPTHQPPTF